MSFDVLIGTICSYMLLLPEIRDMTPLGRWNPFHKFLRKADFYLTARNPPTVQLKLIELPFGELEFPLDLTPRSSAVWTLHH